MLQVTNSIFLYLIEPKEKNNCKFEEIFLLFVFEKETVSPITIPTTKLDWNSPQTIMIITSFSQLREWMKTRLTSRNFWSYWTLLPRSSCFLNLYLCCHKIFDTSFLLWSFMEDHISQICSCLYTSYNVVREKENVNF